MPICFPNNNEFPGVVAPALPLAAMSAHRVPGGKAGRGESDRQE